VAGVNTLIHGSFRSVSKFRSVTAAIAVLAFAFTAAQSASAQLTRRPRRESTANRRLRIQHAIDDTYGRQWEAAGGGGFLRFRPGPYLRQNNEVSFWVDTMRSFNPRLGIMGTVMGSYGNAKIGNTAFNIPNPQISEYNFLVGPSYRFVAREKFAVSGQVQGGFGLGKFDGGSKGFSATDIGVWNSTLAPSFSAGISLDYNFDPSLALRITPVYVGTLFQSTLQNSKGINVGFVYRFGRKTQ
jgi:hypothetical protein